MNKKINSMLSAVMPLLAFCGISAVTSCSSRSSSGNGDELVTDSIACSDSLISNGARAYCSISVDYPENGPSGTIDSIRGWIAQRLSTIGYTDPAMPAPYASATANLSNGQRMIEAVCKAALADAGKEFKALDSINALNPDYAMQYEYSWNIRKIYETPKIVTYNANTYTYLGGAHGSSFNIGQTFNAETGAEIGLDMFRPDSLARVNNLIKAELMKYFNATTAQELKDALLINPDTLPLPVAPLTLMPDGVSFIYQQYEIAPYAEGMPNGIIPYTLLTGCFTPAAQSLLPTPPE